MELKIEYLPVGKLKPYEKNTRKHQEKDITEIEKSITKYGFDDPIGIWGEQNIIVEGHGRLIAAKRLGMAEVPVIRLDHLTDEQRREYAIMHNRTAELSEWDFELLESEMADLDLDGFDLDFNVSDNSEWFARTSFDGAEREEENEEYNEFLDKFDAKKQPMIVTHRRIYMMLWQTGLRKSTV